MRALSLSISLLVLSVGGFGCGPQRVELHEIELPEPQGRWSVSDARSPSPQVFLSDSILVYGRTVERAGRSDHLEPLTMDLQSGQTRPLALPTFEGLVRKDVFPMSDGRRLLMATRDFSSEGSTEGAFYFWDGEIFEELLRTTCITHRAQFEFAPNGRVAFTVHTSPSGCEGAKRMVVYDPQTKELRPLSAVDSKLFGIAQAGELIVFQQGDQLKVHRWSTNDTQVITNSNIQSSAGERPGGVAVSKNGRVAFIDFVGLPFRGPNTLKLWEPTTHAVRTVTESASSVLAFSGDDRFLTYMRPGSREPQSGPSLRLFELSNNADREIHNGVLSESFAFDAGHTRFVFSSTTEDLFAWSFAQEQAVGLKGCAEATRTMVFAEHTALLCDAEGLVVHDRSGAVLLWVEDVSRFWAASPEGPLLFSSQDALHALFLDSLARRTLAPEPFRSLVVGPSHVAFKPENDRIDVLTLVP